MAITTDIEQLVLRNEEINEAENVRDLVRLKEIIGTNLVFRRRDGSIVDREKYLDTVKRGERAIWIRSIQVFGNRAVVSCIVTDAGLTTHNVRLFIRDGSWQLVGWANQPA